MPKYMTRAAAGMIAALMLAPATLSAQETEHGMILSRTETSVTVRTTSGDKTLKVGPDTKIQEVAGSLGVRKKDHPASDLIRGLAVDFKASGDEAKEITFKPSSLKTARQINAGLFDTETQVAANKAGIEENADRIDNVGELVAKDRAKVFFAVGSTQLTAEGQEELKSLAEKAKGTKGYRLAIVGRADPTGDAAANRRLSLKRAETVKAYLVENCGVLPGRIVPSTALGENSPAQDPDPPKNDAEARRVTVTIMVSGSAPT